MAIWDKKLPFLNRDFKLYMPVMFLFILYYYILLSNTKMNITALGDKRHIDELFLTTYYLEISFFS